jgi:VWFA-related protein
MRWGLSKSFGRMGRLFRLQHSFLGNAALSGCGVGGRTEMKILPLVLILVAVQATAQQIGQNTSGSASGTYTLTAKAQLVVETVVVKDKQGKFISGLSAKDFTVTEDGTPQTIRFCQHQNLAAEEAPLAPAAPGTEQIKLYKQLTRTQLAPEAPENSRYKNRRLLALYFDMSAMHPADQLRALSAAEKFLRTQMTTVDLVAILRYQGGSVDILQDFSADRNKLLSILETMIVGEGQGSAETVDDASSADTGAAFGQDDTEFNVFNTDRQLSALQTAAKMLSQFNEKKSLIYFASGLRLNGIDNEAQLHATVDAAIRAGVSFWPVDARGLVAQAPLGDATQGSPGNSGMYSGGAAIAHQQLPTVAGHALRSRWRYRRQSPVR